MGNIIRRKSAKKTAMNEQTLLRKVWTIIGDNPQYHGNVFFLGFCKANPQYTKYFTLDPEMPLTIDVQITMHFSIIMETVGYLVVDYYQNPKQYDYFIGYIAMVHKDMNLIRPDMTKFGINLVEYLTGISPTIMTPDCQKIVSRYILNLVENISITIDKLKQKDPLDPFKSQDKINSPFVRLITCQDNLIYGKTIDFWTKRKRIWEARLNQWKHRMHTIDSRKNSPNTDDDDDSISTQKLNNEDDTSQSTRNSSSETSGKILSLENVEIDSHQPSVTLRTKKIGETEYNVVETINRTEETLPSNSQFEFTFHDNISFSSDSYEDTFDASPLRAINNMRIDSIARQRRRERYSV